MSSLSGRTWEAFPPLGASGFESLCSDVMMLTVMAAAALLLTFDVQAIQYLKEGPVIDAEGREYKSPPLRVEKAGLRRIASAIRVRCTDTSMMVVVKADLFETGRPVSPKELFLGEAWNPSCYAAASTDGEYVIKAELLECGSN